MIVWFIWVSFTPAFNAIVHRAIDIKVICPIFIWESTSIWFICLAEANTDLICVNATIYVRVVVVNTARIRRCRPTLVTQKYFLDNRLG